MDQRRLGLAVKENFVIGDAFVWRYLYKSSVKDIYSCLVKTSETPKCIEKWSKVLAVEIDTKAVFNKIFRTTCEKCLIWFQYKLLYNLLPTGCYLFQRQLVDSPVCLLQRCWRNFITYVLGLPKNPRLMVWCTGMASYQLHTLY